MIDNPRKPIYNPRLQYNSSPKQRYKYPAQPDRYAAISLGHKTFPQLQFSPYKPVYYERQYSTPPANRMSPSISGNIREFSPYETRSKGLEVIETKHNSLLDTLKEAQYKTLQQTALSMTQQLMIQELGHLNQSLRGQVSYFKDLALRLEQQLHRSNLKAHQENAFYAQQDSLKSQQISRMKKDIEVLLEKIKTPKTKRSECATSKLEELIVARSKESSSLSEIVCCKKSIQQNLASILKRFEKLESFVQAVVQMKTRLDKSNRENIPDLKQCWRWLKHIIQEASRSRKYKDIESQLSKIELPRKQM